MELSEIWIGIIIPIIIGPIFVYLKSLRDEYYDKNCVEIVKKFSIYDKVEKPKTSRFRFLRKGGNRRLNKSKKRYKKI